MKTNRLEAFSDSVIAIIITIMVIEFKAPQSTDLIDLKPLIPKFLSYILSFIYLSIYWNNHHHIINTVKSVTGDMLWANLHLLFWLSLIPFATAWVGENSFKPKPMALYGFVLFMASIAFGLLQKRIIKKHGTGSILAKAVGKDLKGKMSLLLYVIAIVSSWFLPWLAGIIYIVVAVMWLIPDKRIESEFKQEEVENQEIIEK